MSLNALAHDERAIISALLDDALSASLLVSVYDGEEWALTASDSRPRLADVIGATDYTTLRFRDPAKLDSNGKPSTVGSVFLVHGNGCHVIADCSDNPATENLLRRASVVAERFGA